MSEMTAIDCTQLQSRSKNLSRRGFLGALAGLGGATLVMTSAAHSQSPAPPRPHVKPTTADLFINHVLNQEMRWEHMYSRGYLTPTPLFFIRNHDPTPSIDVKTWRLRSRDLGSSAPSN